MGWLVAGLAVWLLITVTTMAMAKAAAKPWPKHPE